MDVLTGVPNYPSGVVPAGYRAHRRSVEDLDGLRVLRAPLYPSHDRSTVRRAANYLSWAASSTVVGRGLLRSADASLVYGSPITAATAAMAARMRWRTPYVLMVMDLWPDSVFATGFLTDGAGRRLAAGALGGLPARVSRWAAHITRDRARTARVGTADPAAGCPHDRGQSTGLIGQVHLVAEFSQPPHQRVVAAVI